MIADDTPLPERMERTAADNLATLSMLTGLVQAAQIIPAKMRAADGSLPLTVISGFLGAGKTTLLNRLLTQPHGRKIAVLVNDFGAINIDAELVRSKSSDTIELTNGCACCTVAGDLTRALVQVAQREELPDCIVLEASGAADPRGILLVALSNPSIRFDGVVTLVDAEGIEERLAEWRPRITVEQQIKAADILLLNKCDLVAPTARSKVRDTLARLSSVPIVETINAEVPIDIVLGLGSARLPDTGGKAPHDIGLSTWHGRWRGPLDADRLRGSLRKLPADVLRAKGIFKVSGQTDSRTIFHRVGRRESWTTERDTSTNPTCAIVVIGPAETMASTDFEAIFREVGSTQTTQNPIDFDHRTAAQI